MRLICTLKNQQQAQTFSFFLKKQGIDNQLEISKITDWGSPDYGTVDCNIWVYEEDKIDTTMRWYKLFEQNPEDPRFSKEATNTPTEEIEEEKQKVFEVRPPKRPRSKRGPIGTITLYFLILCTLLFTYGIFTRPPIEPPPPNLPRAPLYLSQIKKTLFFDWSYAYEIVEKLKSAYGIEKLHHPEELPPPGQFLFQQYHKTPYWNGIYEKVVVYLRDRAQITFQAPMFEKIRAGEWWRLFTPAVLHASLIHLFFNMMWLLVLGKQMEERIPKFRYLLFIIITGIISNIAQYLMSGTNFIGFSGVLCAMIAFIWMRQKRAAWEGYQLIPATMAMISMIILGLFAIQVVSFILEIQGKIPFSPGIANTAHLTGAFAGFVLGRTEFFAWKQR